MKYTYKEALDASLEFFSGDELAADVFVKKYALQDLESNMHELTPDDMHHRLAGEFARVESKYPNAMSEDEIYELFSSWRVVPQGSPMSAIGNTFQVQSLSNCFVVDSPHDSYGGIMKTDQEQVQIMKRRGGVGFDISTLRPKGFSTANAARTTDGIGVFMERFSNTSCECAQDGRRGALMLTISVHHPEVLRFANIKRDKKKVTGANVSIRMSDEFMNAVIAGEKYQQRFPVDRDVPHQVEQWVDARETWDNIISAMRDCSEPGMLFWDTIKQQSPADAYSEQGYGTVSTNPCGEITLSPYDSCRLLIVNLSKFVCNPFTKNASFDYYAFSNVVQKSQRLMDDLIDLELEAVDRIIAKIKSDPEPDDVKNAELSLWCRIKTVAENGRRTGLGITALGDTFAYMNMKYGSEESIILTEKIYKALATNSYISSINLAQERGAFPVFSHDVEKEHPFIKRILDAIADESPTTLQLYKKHGRRNIANTTTAPVGSTSLMTQTTSGCEPTVFIKSVRKRKIQHSEPHSKVDEVDALGDRWQHYNLFHYGVKKWMSLTGNDNIDESPYAGSTVEEIDWEKKIDIQATAQKWICHSISNTMNLPTDVQEKTVSELCLRAWQTGCKGITIYRIGSRSGVIVKENDRNVAQEVIETHAPKRPDSLPCDIHRVSVKGQSYLVIVGLLNNKPYEIFCGFSEQIEVPKRVKSGTLFKNGKVEGVSTYNLHIPLGDDDELVFKNIVDLFDNPLYGSITRTMSLALRHGVPVQYLAEQLRKDKHSDITSFSSVIARVLSKHYIVDGTKALIDKACEQCGSTTLAYQQGCVQCVSCGASKCG